LSLARRKEQREGKRKRRAGEGRKTEIKDVEDGGGKRETGREDGCKKSHEGGRAGMQAQPALKKRRIRESDWRYGKVGPTDTRLQDIGGKSRGAGRAMMAGKNEHRGRRKEGRAEKKGHSAIIKQISGKRRISICSLNCQGRKEDDRGEGRLEGLNQGD